MQGSVRPMQGSVRPMQGSVRPMQGSLRQPRRKGLELSIRKEAISQYNIN